MANKREISVAINLTAKMNQVQQEMEKMQKNLAKLSLPKGLASEFTSLFSEMQKEFDKLSSKTANGKLKLIDKKEAEKTIEKIDSLYSLLIQKYESKGIGSAALKEDQKAIDALSTAIKNYSAETKEIEKEQAKLTREVEKQIEKQEKLLEIQKSQKVVSEAEMSAQRAAEKQAAKESRDAEKELIKARQELDRKIAESGGKYKVGDIDTKGSGLRKTDAYKNYKRASENAAIAAKNKKDIETVGKTLTTATKQKEELKQVGEAIDAARAKLESFNSTQKASKEIEAFEKIKKDLMALEDLDLAKYGINLEEVSNINQLAAALDKLGREARQNSDTMDDELVATLKKLAGVLNDVEGDTKKATGALEELDESAQQAEAMASRIKSFLGVSGAAQVMRAAFRDAMQTITELDAAMTEMAVVTDLTVGDYWAQLPEYSQRASELGVSINSAYEAATLYYQQGLKTNEVNAISTQTLKMAKIAGLDAATATDKMTAALRGFNMELNEASAQRVADVYSELAAITAADTKEIANAMTKTASIAHSAGMEFETTAAFLSQIVETTRESAETAGTALKTVIARFQELKKSPSEIGEIDGEIVDANKIETALRSVGVALRDSSGQFRNLDEVFLELSKKWDGLDTNTQRYIATIAAGSRQQSRFIAMMSDYERTQELVTAANNSAGASNRQFEKTLDSLSSKMEKLKNAWHEFTMGILDSDLVKTGIDILTKFLEIINKATNSLNGIGNSLTKVLGIFTLFKLGKVIFEKLQQPIFNLFSSVTDEASRQGYMAGKNWAKSAEKGAEDQLKNPSENEDVGSKNKKLGFKEQWSLGSTARNDYKTQKASLAAAKKEYEEATKRTTNYALTGNSAYEESLKDLKKASDEYRKQEQKTLKASKKAWEETGKAMGQVGAGVSAVGMGLSFIGGILSEMGLEELGKTISGLGQGIMLIGSALQALPAIISLIGTIAEVTGLTMAATLGWLIAIVAAVVALGVIIVNVVKDIQANSPEGRLKAAQEAAEGAAEAADRAVENFNNLNNAIDDLSNKYDSLDGLTRGTKEWNAAVQEINNSVLDLIEQYPALADFMENKNGVLTLALDDEGVQNIIIEAQTASVVAQNTAKVANAQAILAEDQLYAQNYAKDMANKVYSTTYKEASAEILETSTNMHNANVQMGAYDSPAGQVGGLIGSWLASIIGGSVAANEAKKEAEKTLTIGGDDKTNIARALAEGVFYQDKDGNYQITKGSEERAGELGITETYLNELKPLLDEWGDDLTELGKKLISNEKALRVQYDGIVANTKALIDLPESFTKEQQNQAHSYIDALMEGADYEAIYKEELKNITSLKDSEIETLVSSVYGTGATWDKDKQQIVDASGNVLQEDVTEQKIFSLEANRRATARVEKAGESAYSFVQRMKSVAPEAGTSIERLFSDAEGGNLTQQDLKKLEGIDFSGQWNSLTQAQKDLFGNDPDKFASYITGAQADAQKGFTDASARLGKYGYSTTSFNNVTSRQATQLAEIATSMSHVTLGKGNFVDAFNSMVGSDAFANMSDSQKNIFISEIAALSSDPSNRENWEALAETFEEHGIGVPEQFEAFVEKAMAGTSATYSTSHLQGMGVSDGLISHYNKAVAEGNSKVINNFHSSFKKWKEDYDIATSEAKKAEHELVTQVAEKLIEEQEKQLEAQEKTADAMNEASEKMLNKLQSMIDADRQAREEQKKKQDLSDKYARLSYLRQDTSGSNILELKELEKEIAEQEQDLQDYLVDQQLQAMEDANEAAAEQREEQIRIAQAQFDIQKSNKSFYEDAKVLVNKAKEGLQNGIPIEDTDLGKIYSTTKFATDYESSVFWNTLRSNLSQAINGTSLEVQNTSGGGGGRTSAPSLNGKVSSVLMETAYATGGLANFTGPAWLDGTPSKPEYVLSAAQTERFFSLVDVLEDYSTKPTNTPQKNEIQVDVDINVENISSDYDVEQMANKIRSMLYNDAMYRNVNNINLIR